EADDALGLHEAWSGLRADCLEFIERASGDTERLVRFSPDEHRNDVDALRTAGVLVVPAADVEQRETFLSESVATLDAMAPPLAEVMTWAKLQQLLGVVLHPASETEVVIFGRDEARARLCGNARAVLADHNGGVRAVDLL